MASVVRTNWILLAAWLLLCPALNFAGVYLLLPSKHLYQSTVQTLVLTVIYLLPFMGAVAIVRLLRVGRMPKILAAAAYLAVTLPMALFTVFSITCSWAPTCL